MGQPSTAAKSRWRKETLSLGWEHPGKTLHFAPLEHFSFIPAAKGGQGDLGDTDTAALGSVFQPAARAFQELQNGFRF